jgi:thiol-disulfide isomerase/thioredoxin
MKKIYSILSILAIGSTSFAQVSFDEGDIVPDFTITDLNGETHTLYDYTAAGKYVIVDFFAYWCGPCAANAPIINDFYHKYGCNQGNVIVLGVEYEGTETQTHEFEEWAGIDTDNPYPSASGITGGGAAVHAAYNAAAFPTIIAISPENVLLNHDIWPIAGVETIEANLPEEVLVEMVCSVNVDENALNADFSLSPNPANEIGFINLGLTQNSLIEIVVSDALGRQVEYIKAGIMNAGMQRIELNVSAYRTGVYNVSVRANGILAGTKHLMKS